MTDVLSSLEPYYKDGIQVSDEEKIKALHAVFYRDFFSDGVFLDGEKIKVKPYKYANRKKDNLPETFETYTEKFVHIITRSKKATHWKTASKVREFNEDRANRIHWFKPIIENQNDKRITRFKYIEDNGREREYFWYRSKQYIVILEHIAPGFDLITGFCVDSDNQPYYQKKYLNRIK